MGKRKDRGNLPLFDLPLNTAASPSPEPAWDAALSDTALSAAAAHSQTATVAEGSSHPSPSEPGEPQQPIVEDVDRQPDAAETDREDYDGGTAKPERKPEPARRAALGDRLLAGLADLSVQLLMLGLAISATHALGVTVTLDDWMPFGVLALIFSFLYWVVPLAFWGQTPGMAWVGHTARSLRGEPLTFSQTFLRWLGALLTLALAGLPLLLALTGRSLSDRLSDSQTVAV